MQPWKVTSIESTGDHDILDAMPNRLTSRYLRLGKPNSHHLGGEETRLLGLLEGIFPANRLCVCVCCVFEHAENTGKCKIMEQWTCSSLGAYWLPGTICIYRSGYLFSDSIRHHDAIDHCHSPSCICVFSSGATDLSFPAYNPSCILCTVHIYIYYRERERESESQRVISYTNHTEMALQQCGSLYASFLVVSHWKRKLPFAPIPSNSHRLGCPLPRTTHP